tara:strand:- start:522 stop:635 length:114 start_codon:yes stop_codon:yes gene_type:complete
MQKLIALSFILHGLQADWPEVSGVYGEAFDAYKKGHI